MEMPRAAIRNPRLQHVAATAIALRGPLRSTHVPPKAADRPSITMAMLKMTAIGVASTPNLVSRGPLNTLKA